MDADTSRARPRAQSRGGTVEPTSRGAPVQEQSRASPAKPRERYELHDARTDLTHRSDSIHDIAAKAELLGSTRFVAITDDGRRTTLERVRGEWQRQTATADPHATREAVQQAGGVRSAPSHETETSGAHADARIERQALVARLEAALQERYLIKRAPATVGDVTIGRTEYRFRGDSSRVAFTESTFRLATDTNSPSVARSMVDVAQARNWRSLRVSGNEDFRRLVWLEASARGVKALGYEPNPADLEVLRRERDARLMNRIELAQGGSPTQALPGGGAEQVSTARGGGGRKTVLAAIEAVLVAKRVPAGKREAVMAAAAEKLAQRMRAGQAPKVRVYDKAAPSQRPTAVLTPEAQRVRDRAAPAR